ncbi:MAG: hypothetical protein ABIQ18_03780 [Umezawaea sp.]
MEHGSSGSRIDVDGAESSGVGPESQWSLAGTRPPQLALRVVGAALGVGVVGGVVTAWLAVLYGAGDVSHVSFGLMIAFPVVLLGMIAWRLAADAGRTGPPPSGWWLGWLAVAGFVLVVFVQGVPQVDGTGEDIARNAAGALLVALFGAAFGAVPAVVSIVVLVPALLLLRAAGVRVPLVAAEVLLTVFAMVVTAVFAQLVFPSLDAGIVSGTATALAGTGAVLTARWCLVDRRV